jgi:hypothetical protein
MAGGSLFGNQVKEFSLKGMIRARVIRNDDPKKEGRLGLSIPTMAPHVPASAQDPAPSTVSVGPDALEHPDALEYKKSVQEDNYIWARPAAWLVENGKGAEKSHGGSYRVPRIGTWIMMYFENEDPNCPYWMPFTPTIEGDGVAGANIGGADDIDSSSGNWSDPAKKANMNVIAEQSSGSAIYIDDNDGSGCIVLHLASGHTLTLHDGGQAGVSLTTAGGHKVHLNDSSKELKLRSAAGHVINMSDTAKIIDMKTISGHSLVLDDNAAQIAFKTASGAASIVLGDNGGLVGFSGQRIDLN